jgi:uncharacterized protein YcgI (DUF1989 family)
MEEITIPACTGAAVTLQRGDRLTIVDGEGEQVADVVALVEGSREFLSVAHTRAKLEKLSIGEGDTLWSNLRRPVLRVARDTVGRHDLLWAACDPERYDQDFGVTGHANCRENLYHALNGRVPYEAVPDPVNVFMATRVLPDGSLDIERPASRAGDEITFEALVPCTVAVSACPQDLNACNGYNPTSLRLCLERGDEGMVNWEQRVADAWASLDDRSEEEFLSLIEHLATELPPDSGIGIFERAASLDSTGHSDLAVPLYRQALNLDLTGERRRRAVIQLASSLRNLGQAEESVALLTAELEGGPDHLNDSVRAFLALALVDSGREREAVSLALTALAPHLPRYQRSLANYARLISDQTRT